MRHRRTPATDNSPRLWLVPHAFSLLGWVPALVAISGVALATAYSGSLFNRLFLATPGTVLFGDIAEAAAGPKARALCYAIGACSRKDGWVGGQAGGCYWVGERSSGWACVHMLYIVDATPLVPAWPAPRRKSCVYTSVHMLA